jgi:hypothetical protein
MKEHPLTQYAKLQRQLALLEKMTEQFEGEIPTGSVMAIATTKQRLAKVAEVVRALTKRNGVPKPGTDVAGPGLIVGRRPARREDPLPPSDHVPP